MPLSPLYTPRLILRSFTQADAPRVQELAGNARIAGMTAVIPHPYPDGLAEKWIASLDLSLVQGKEFTYAVTLAGTRTPGRELDHTDTGHLVGTVGIGHDEDPTVAILGYWIGLPYWNKGFATEAANAILNFAFTRCRYLRVDSYHFAHNPASGRVMQKIGMTRHGDETRHFPARGQTYDLVHYTLTRDAWLRRRTAHRWKPATPKLHVAGVT